MEAWVSMRATAAPPWLAGSARKAMTAAWSGSLMHVSFKTEQQALTLTLSRCAGEGTRRGVAARSSPLYREAEEG